MLVSFGKNTWWVDGEMDGEIYLRPVVDGIAFWPGARVNATEFRAAQHNTLREPTVSAAALLPPRAPIDPVGSAE